MAKPIRTTKSSFIAGEVSPLIASEVESESYAGGMSLCENFMVDINDGIKNRPGLGFADKAYNIAQKSRFIEFQFNEEQSYVLELCDSGMRVWKDLALVLRSIRSATYKWTVSADGTSNYYLELAAGGDPGLIAPSQMYEDSVSMTAGTLSSLAVSEFSYGDSAGDGLGYDTIYVRLADSTDPDGKAADYLQVPFLTASPYPIADVAEVNGDAASADVLYLLHGDYEPQKVTRTADDAWTITAMTGLNGPYKPRAVGDEDIKIKAALISGTTWEFTADSSIFDDVEVGEPIKLGFVVPGDAAALHWSWFIVSLWTSGTVIRATLQGDSVRPSYQQVSNPKFLKGTESWDDNSTVTAGVIGSLLTYDFTNQTAKLLDGVGDAKMEQAVLTLPQVLHFFNFTISAMSLNLVDLVDAAYRWTISGVGGGIYYLELAAGGDPSVIKPVRLYQNGTIRAEQTAATLPAGTWDYGDIDTLGYNTIYVRLDDDADPDSKAQGYVQSSQFDPTVTVKIGTTSGASDIYLSAALVAPTTLSLTVKPTTEIVYISFDSVGSLPGDTIEISSVELIPVDIDASGNYFHTTTDWGLAAWNSTHGYPRVGIVNGQRFIPANNSANPQTVWPSVLGDYDNFEESTPTRSTDSFSFFPSTETINGIKWIIEKDGIKVGTAGAVWRVFAPSGGAISPTDIAIEVDEAEGSLDLRPIVAHNAIIMTPRGVSPVLEMVSSLEAKGFATRDIASRAAHLFKNRRIVRWAFAKDPDSVIWVVLDNGQLLGCTYHRRLGVWAWHKHTCPLGVGYVDVVVIPNSSDDNIDDVYFLVNRGTEQSPNYYVETLNARITPREAPYGLTSVPSDSDYRFLDSSLTYESNRSAIQGTGVIPAPPHRVLIASTAHGFSDGDNIRLENTGQAALDGNVYEVSDKTANTYNIKDIVTAAYITLPASTRTTTGGEARKMVTVISGLDHLEGKTVTAIVDGFAVEGLVVSSGSITVPEGTYIHAGIPYDALGETLDIETVFQSGATQGRRKGTTEVDTYFVESRNCKVYPSNDTTNIKEFQFEDEVFGEDPPSLYDGIKSVDVKSEVSKQVRLVFKQDKPYPLHIRRVIIHVEYAG